MAIVAWDRRKRNNTTVFRMVRPARAGNRTFALLLVDKIDHEYANPILQLAMNAVWISALLRGTSALPGARWYANKRAR